MPDSAWVAPCLYDLMKLEHYPILSVSKLRLAKAPELVNGKTKDIARSRRSFTAPLAQHKPELIDFFSRVGAKTRTGQCLLTGFPQHGAPPEAPALS